MVLAVSGGTRVWDSISGNAANFDYFLVMPSISSTIGAASTGYLQMYIANVTTSDAGTYYCAFYDGTAEINAVDAAAALGTQGGYRVATGTTNLLLTNRNAVSTPFTLAVTTPATATSASTRNSPTTKSIQYSLALLGASTMLF